jgi:hypothetical protein
MVPHASKVARQIAGGLVALGRILRQQAVDQPKDRRRDVRSTLCERFRLVAENGGQRFGHGSRFERFRGSEHLVEHDAEGELVGSEIHRLAARLLGRHVGDRPEDDPFLADHAERGRARVGRVAPRDVVAREAEVENLGVAVLREEDVLGLDVPVDDPFLMSGRERLGDLAGDLESPARRHRAGRHRHPQRLALEELADGIANAARLPHVEESQDVGVRQRGDRAGLRLEARQRALVGRNVIRKDLDRHVAAEARIPRPVDLPHSTCAERRQDLVGTQSGSGRKRHETSGKYRGMSLR